MFAFLCTRLGKRGKTQSSRFRICFCFYLTLFLLCDGSMSGKLGSQHQLFEIIVWIIFSFKWYETVVRNEHLFMLIKRVFHSIHVFWLYILVHVIAQNVRVFRVMTWPNSALCVHLGLGTGGVSASSEEEEREDRNSSWPLGKKTTLNHILFPFPLKNLTYVSERGFFPFLFQPSFKVCSSGLSPVCGASLGILFKGLYLTCS